MAYGKSLQQRIARLQELIAEQTSFSSEELEKMMRDPSSNMAHIFKLLIENQVSIQLTRAEENFKDLEMIKNDL